mgnify:CR=1 FL=1
MMNVSILALLMSAILALSGGYGAGGTDASRITTISDVVVSIGDAEYPLDAAASLGAASSAEGGAVDFALTAGGEELFPMQARVSDAGVSLVVGESSAVYTFSAEYLDALVGGDIPVQAILDVSEGMGAMFDLLGSPDLVNGETNLALMHLAAEIAGDGCTTEPTTITLGGEELPATRMIFALDTEQYAEYMDQSFARMDELYPAGYAEAYDQMFRALYELTGEEFTPESYAEQFVESGTEYEFAVDLAYAEDGRFVLTQDVTTTLDGLLLEVPMEVAYMGEGVWNETGDILLDGVEFGRVDVESDGETVEMTFGFEMTDAFAMEFDLANGVNGEGQASQTLSLRYDFAVDGLSYAMSYDSAMNADASGNSHERASFALELPDQPRLAISWIETAAPGELPDRMSGRSEIVISSDEEMASASSRLAMSVMGLAGDAEALLTEDSVAAMIEAVTDAYGSALFGATGDASSIGVIGGADGPTSIYTSDIYAADDSAIIGGEDDGFSLFPESDEASADIETDDSTEAEGADAAIIGGADGPTSVYVSGKGDGFSLFPESQPAGSDNSLSAK